MHEVHRIELSSQFFDETCGYTIYVDRSYNRTTRAHSFEVLVTRNGVVRASEGTFSTKADAVARATAMAAEYEARVSVFGRC